MVVVVGGAGAVLYHFPVGGLDNLGWVSGVGRILDVEEGYGGNSVSLYLSGHLDLLVSTEVQVKGLESSEGVEHLRTVGSRSFSGEGIVGEVVVETSIVL